MVGAWDDAVVEDGRSSEMEDRDVKEESVDETEVVDETDETEVSEQAEGDDTEYGVDDTEGGEGESTGTVCGESGLVSSATSRSVVLGNVPNNSRCSGVR